MYSSVDVSLRIKQRAKEKQIKIRDLLDTCNLSINAISQTAGKKGMSSFSLAKIADELDCSVDYLLGRTDNPEINRYKSSALCVTRRYAIMHV